MRIAHISDIHLLSLKGSRWLDFLSKRWIGGLNLLTSRSRHYQAAIFEAMVEDLNRAQVDHVVVTGDITNVALEAEFAFAREKFDLIELGPSGVTVIPGNHDAYVDEGRVHFEAYFADFFASDPAHACDEPWPAVRIRDQVAIIGLSTSLQTPWFTCWGQLGQQQCTRLESILASDALDGLFRLVAIHHPPAGKRAALRNRGLRDHQDFAQIICRAGAELVLHGHEHEDLYEELPCPAGVVPVRGIQSGTYALDRRDRGARYRIYEISAAGPQGRPAIAGESLRVWNPVENAFESRPAVAELVPEPA